MSAGWWMSSETKGPGSGSKVKCMLYKQRSNTCLFAFSKLLYWISLTSYMKLFNNLDLASKLFKVKDGILKSPMKITLSWRNSSSNKLSNNSSNWKETTEGGT